MVKKEGDKADVYITIRIYQADHEVLLNKFSKNQDFAEIIHILTNKNARNIK